MSSTTVVASYRPHPGQAAALLELVRIHVPTLRRHGLATDTPVLCLRAASDGTLIEIFEWTDEEGAQKAHATPEIAELWEAFAKISDFEPLAKLPEAAGPFPHFERIELGF